MKKIKSAISMVLVAVMMLCALAACHPANETAVTVGDMQVSAGVYLCALIQADGEGRNTIDTLKAKEETAEETDTSSSVAAVTEVDYYKEKIDDTDFTTWVKNRALQLVTEYAAYTALFNEKGLKLSETEISEINSLVDTYWNSYGYSEIYEPNGVSLESYKEFFTYPYRINSYFMSLYGEGGEREIAEDDINKTISENFTIAKVLSISYTTTDEDGNKVDLSEDEIAEAKKRIKSYATRLEAGENFYDVYCEEVPDLAKTYDKDEAEPYLLTAFVSESAQEYCSSQYYAYDHFEDVKALENGKTFVADNDDEGYSVLMFKEKDVMSYTDYIEEFKQASMYILKRPDFDTEIQTYVDSFSVETNNYAIDRFKPSNIEYPTTKY